MVPPLLECLPANEPKVDLHRLRGHSRFTRHNGPQAGSPYWPTVANRSRDCSGVNFDSLIS
ncbi:hypothetical protein [Cohnella boryungensis]|uniref:Uncharacterized protein n=1 Tax=Cohnella boryungensis TaxID=768479 RepID=A0ABV8SD75_9BACL